MQLYTCAMLTIAAVYIQLSSAGRLYTTPNIHMNYREAARRWENLTCEAEMTAGEFMIFSKTMKGSNLRENIAIVTVVTLDTVSFIPTRKFQPATWSRSTIISNTAVNVTLGYNIPVINRTHTGHYQCQLNSQLATYYLNIITPPHTFTLMANTTPGLQLKELSGFDVNEYPGSLNLYLLSVNTALQAEVELSVSVLGIPKSVVHWRNVTDGTPLGTGNVLTLDRVAELNESVLLVSAANGHGYYNVSVIFSMEYPPQTPIITDTDFYPMEGDNVAVHCQFDAYPAVTFLFIKVDTVNNNWIRLPNVGGTFYLNSVQFPRDIGIYMCIGDNPHGRDNQTFFIHGKPKMVKVNVLGIYDDSVDLQIKAQSARQVSFHITVIRVDANNVTVSTTNIVRFESDKLPEIQLVHTLRSLKPDHRYELKIAAVNEYGNAGTSEVFFTSKEGVSRPATTMKYSDDEKGNVDGDKWNSSIRHVGSVLTLMLTLILQL